MFDELTLQQFCALDCNRNIVVTAGPGAGKTGILSHRYCFLLLSSEDISIPQILTLTFSEKAAEEMKTRIYRMLSLLSKNLNSTLNNPLKSRIERAREGFYKNRISTIHSFCARLLRDNPVEAEIDPGFNIIQGIRQKEIIEESIERAVSSIWKNEKDLLMPLLNTFGNRSSLISAIRDSIEHPVTFQRSLDTAKRLFNNERWIDSAFRDYCGSIMEDEIVPYYNGLKKMEKGSGHYEELMSLFHRWNTEEREKNEFFGIPGLFEGIRALVEGRESGSSLLQVKNGLRTFSYVDLAKRYFPDIFFNQNPDVILQKELGLFFHAAGICMAEYRKEKQRLNSMDFNDLETEAQLFLEKLYCSENQEPIERIRNSFRHIMVDEFQDTNSIQWNIIKMLCVNRKDGIIGRGRLFVVGDKRQAIYRFRGGDVTVFEAATREIQDSNRGEPTPMFWQDEENRNLLRDITGPDSDQFIEKQEKCFLSLSLEERENILKGNIYLPHNFRSDSRPVSFFNRAFTQIFGNRGAEKIMNYETPPGLISLPDFKKGIPENTGSVTFYLQDRKSKRESPVETEAQMIGEIIENIMGRHGRDNYEYNAYPDIRLKIENNRPAIGILFFTFNHLKIFENVLRSLKIPFSVHRGKGFYRCSEVMDMLQLLNYLSDKRQKISLLAALRSPVFGLKDSEVFDLFYDQEKEFSASDFDASSYEGKVFKQLEYWRSLSARVPVTELMRTIIFERSLTAVYSAHPEGAQKLANIEKLVGISRRFQSDQNGSLKEFIRYGLKMADEEEHEGEAVIMSEDAGPVSLMTVHAAKGLEFPMVIIPDLNHRPPHRRLTGKSLRLYAPNEDESKKWNSEEGELPVWQVEAPLLEYRKKYTPMGHLLIRRDRLENIAENRRVFYVACTRAMNHLVLIGSGSKDDEKKENALTVNDYREKASIQDLLEDIFEFGHDCSDGETEHDSERIDYPDIMWKEPKNVVVQGVQYKKERPEPEFLGVYSEEIKKTDISGPVKTPFYCQLSFTSIQTYMKCPIRFYYENLLGLKPEYLPANSEYPGMADEGAEIQYDRDEYESKDSLILGNLIHSYLERHRFGDAMNESLFSRLKKKMERSAGMSPATLQRAFDQLMNTVNDVRLIDLIKDSHGDSEVPFLMSVGRGIEFRGVIDRIFKDKKSGLWSIIDWKSNDLENRDPESVVRENLYDMQLAFYRYASEKLLKEKTGKQYIYFTSINRLLEVEWKGDPVAVMKGLASKIETYENNPDEWKRDLAEIRREGSACRFCEYFEYGI